MHRPIWQAAQLFGALLFGPTRTLQWSCYFHFLAIPTRYPIDVYGARRCRPNASSTVPRRCRLNAASSDDKISPAYSQTN